MQKFELTILILGIFCQHAPLSNIYIAKNDQFSEIFVRKLSYDKVWSSNFQKWNLFYTSHHRDIYRPPTPLEIRF